MSTTADSFMQIIEPYRVYVEEIIQAHLDCFGPKTLLKEACEYALLNGGKRFRPALALMIAKALGNQADVSQAALGVEFFHTASLIADDLPCMDNDGERRNKPTVHIVYGESAALLATYALIAAGYQCLVKNTEVIRSSRLSYSSQCDYLCVLALENATYNTGVFGATGGQFLDVAPEHLSLEMVKETIHKKTVALFEISFVLGWLFGGGDLTQLDLVKKAAEHFGLAFQFADDLGDQEQDLKNGRLINIANFCGEARAKKMFHEEIKNFERVIGKLNIQSNELKALLELLATQVH